FVARLDTDLNVLWAHNSTHTTTISAYYGRGYSIEADADENIVIGGFAWKDITFGTQTFITNNDAGWNPYIAKFDSNGNCLWIRGGTGPQTFDNIYALEIDENKNIYIAGQMDSTITFDGTTLLTANGRIFMNKYDASGNNLWVKQYGDPAAVNQIFTELSIYNN